MTASDETLDAFRDWMTDPRRPDVRSLRKHLVQKALNLFDASRVNQLGPQQQLDLAAALGITIPGPVVKMGLGKPYTPGPRGAVAERPLSRIETFREDLKAKAAARAAAEHDADLAGNLWTVMGAYYDNSTFLLIRQGRIADDQIESFRSQHTETIMILEPALLIGSMSEVRAQASKQFQGTNTNDLTIRVITRKAQA